jgi:hypothetical protein
MEIKKLRADDVRNAHPDWLVWKLGDRWWAMRKKTGAAVGADSLAELVERLRAEEQLLAEVTP